MSRSRARLLPGISAVLIVRDEEEVLGRALESLRGLDETVVCDTGSADRTIEIARAAGAKVVAGAPETPFHFGRARQAALSESSRAWALSIDADEVLLPGAAEILRKASGNLAKGAWEVGFLQRSHAGAAVERQFLKRFFRADLHEWYGRVHEQVVPRSPKTRMGRIDEPLIEHMPKANRDARKGQNLELLEIAVAEGEHGRYPRLLWYLGDEKKSRGDFEGAIDAFRRYGRMARVEGPLWVSEAHLAAGMMLGKLGRIEEALAELARSHEVFPSRREPLYHASELELARGRVGKALEYLDRAIAVPRSAKPDFHLNWEPVWGRIPEEEAGRLRTWIRERQAKEKQG